MTERMLTVAVFNEPLGWSLPDSLIERIRDAAPSDVRVQSVRSRAELREALAETTYLIGLPLTESQFAGAGAGVKWIQLTGSGGESLAWLQPAMESGTRVCSAAPIRAPQSAEHAMALMLALMRKLHDAMAAQTEHRWAAGDIAPEIRDLDGAMVGLVAIDVVGEEIARRAKAFGAEVVAIGPDPENPYLHVDEVLPVGESAEFFRNCDVIVVATPFHEPGVTTIGELEFRAMKSSAILIDVSRGGVVRTGELVTALQSGQIAAAGLDVFEHEPLAPDSPLWTMANVLLTPHVSGASPRYWERAVEVVVRNLRRIEEGRPLLGEIDELMLERFTSPGAA